MGSVTASVVVADPQPSFLEGLRRALPEHAQLRVLAACTDPDHALAAIAEHDPHAALLDVDHVRSNEGELAREIARRGVGTSVVVSAAEITPAAIAACLNNRVTGFLSKRCSIAEIGDALHAAARGDVWLCPRAQQAANLLHLGQLTPLSERQRQILGLVAHGQSDAAIARELFISPETVRTNLKRSSEKLGVRPRAAQAAKALREGWLQ